MTIKDFCISAFIGTALGLILGILFQIFLAVSAMVDLIQAIAAQVAK